MSRGGLAALAGLLKGVGSEVPKHVDAYNADIASQNRDNVLGWAEESSQKWAEERAKIQKLETTANAAGAPLPTDQAEKNAAISSVGIDPDAQLPFEQWVAKKQTSRAGVAKIQERLNEGGAGLKVDGVAGSKTRQAIAKAIQAEKKADDNDPYLQDAMERGGLTLEEARALRAQANAKRDALGPVGGVAAQASAAQEFMGGGKAKVGQKTTSRDWSSETADRIRDKAVASMNQTLDRKEQPTSDIDLEQERLRHKYGLLQPYASKLGEKDLPAILDEIRLMGESRKTRDAANSQLRGDQTHIGTAILDVDRAMAQTALSAEASASEGEKRDANRIKVASINQAGANNRNDKKLDHYTDKADSKLISSMVETSRKAWRDREFLAIFIARNKIRSEDDVRKNAQLFGLTEIPSSWFRNGKLDVSAFNAEKASAKKNYEDWNQRAREAAGVDAPAREPSGKGKSRGTSGRKKLSEY